MLENLIGYQILEINDCAITLKKDESVITVEINEDSGDCCGYNNISTDLLYIPNSENNPVITSVETIREECEYGDGDVVVAFGMFGYDG